MSWRTDIDLSRKEIAALLNLTPQRVDQLVREGHITKSGRSRYPLVGSVGGYIRFLKDEGRRTSKSAADSRVRDARAAEIELRVDREKRKLIALDEAAEFVARNSGDYLISIGSLPARITRDPRERQRIEAICDAERLRLTDQYAERARALRTGLPADQASDEDDA